MVERTLQLGEIQSKDDLLRMGQQKYNAYERDHYAARYWMRDDRQGQLRFEAQRRETEISQAIGSLTLQLELFDEELVSC